MIDSTWRTKEGKDVPIINMTDEHLENTIAMIERKSERLQQEYIESLVELRIVPADRIAKYKNMTPQQFVESRKHFRELFREQHIRANHFR